jgi:hypothetical protein
MDSQQIADACAKKEAQCEACQDAICTPSHAVWTTGLARSGLGQAGDNM